MHCLPVSHLLLSAYLTRKFRLFLFPAFNEQSSIIRSCYTMLKVGAISLWTLLRTRCPAEADPPRLPPLDCPRTRLDQPFYQYENILILCFCSGLMASHHTNSILVFYLLKNLSVCPFKEREFKILCFSKLMYENISHYCLISLASKRIMKDRYLLTILSLGIRYRMVTHSLTIFSMLASGSISLAYFVLTT